MTTISPPTLAKDTMETIDMIALRIGRAWQNGLMPKELAMDAMARLSELEIERDNALAVVATLHSQIDRLMKLLLREEQLAAQRGYSLGILRHTVCGECAQICAPIIDSAMASQGGGDG